MFTCWNYFRCCCGFDATVCQLNSTAAITGHVELGIRVRGTCVAHCFSAGDADGGAGSGSGKKLEQRFSSKFFLQRRKIVSLVSSNVTRPCKCSNLEPVLTGHTGGRVRPRPMTSPMVNIPVQGGGGKDPHRVLTLVRGHGPLVRVRGFAVRVTKWTRASSLIQSMMTSVVTSSSWRPDSR